MVYLCSILFLFVIPTAFSAHRNIVAFNERLNQDGRFVGPPRATVKTVNAVARFSGQHGIHGAIFFDQDHYDGAPVRVYGVLNGLPYMPPSDPDIPLPTPPAYPIFDFLMRHPGQPLPRSLFAFEGGQGPESGSFWSHAWKLPCRRARAQRRLNAAFRTLKRRKRQSPYGFHDPIPWHPRHFPPTTSTTIAAHHWAPVWEQELLSPRDTTNPRQEPEPLTAPLPVQKTVETFRNAAPVAKVPEIDDDVDCTDSVSGRPLPPGPSMHGIHVHRWGNLTGANCRATSAHFDPDWVRHGGRGSSERHVGDLGNVVSDLPFFFSDARISLFGRNSVLGRSVVVHALADDLGRGWPRRTSRFSGNAGRRLACAVIGRRDLTFFDPVQSHNFN